MIDEVQLDVIDVFDLLNLKQLNPQTEVSDLKIRHYLQNLIFTAIHVYI